MKVGTPIGANEEIMAILNELFPQIGYYPDESQGGNPRIGGRRSDIAEFVRIVEI